MALLAVMFYLLFSQIASRDDGSTKKPKLVAATSYC
jgi:hypothetical protein